MCIRDSYNIERLPRTEDEPDRLRITLAVAGFAREQLEITLEESQLTIRGRQSDDKNRQFLHRGIAARPVSYTHLDVYKRQLPQVTGTAAKLAVRRRRSRRMPLAEARPPASRFRRCRVGAGRFVCPPSSACAAALTRYGLSLIHI